MWRRLRKKRTVVAAACAAVETLVGYRRCGYWMRLWWRRRCRWAKWAQENHPSRSSRYASTSCRRAKDHRPAPSRTRHVPLHWQAGSYLCLNTSSIEVVFLSGFMCLLIIYLYVRISLVKFLSTNFRQIFDKVRPCDLDRDAESCFHFFASRRMFALHKLHAFSEIKRRGHYCSKNLENPKCGAEAYIFSSCTAQSLNFPSVYVSVKYSVMLTH